MNLETWARTNPYRKIMDKVNALPEPRVEVPYAHSPIDWAKGAQKRRHLRKEVLGSINLRLEQLTHEPYYTEVKFPKIGGVLHTEVINHYEGLGKTSFTTPYQGGINMDITSI